MDTMERGVVVTMRRGAVEVRVWWEGCAGYYVEGCGGYYGEGCCGYYVEGWRGV